MGDFGSGFSFGGGGDDKKFSFGDDKKSDSGFNFGGSNDKKSDFSFGNDKSDNKTNNDFSFGGSSSGFGSSGNTSSQSSVLLDQLSRIQEAYHHEKVSCRFNTFFYNTAVKENGIPDIQYAQSVVHAVMKQHQAYLDPKKVWDAYLKSKNPAKLVPVPCRSFTELGQRIEAQQDRCKKITESLHMYEDKVNVLNSDHKVKNLATIEKIKDKHQILSARVLTLQKQVEVLMQRGIGLSNTDNQIKQKLDKMQEEFYKPNEYRGRLNDLQPQFDQYFSRDRHMLVTQEKLDDPATRDKLMKLLQLHTEGLKVLTAILKKDMKDVKLILEK